MSGQEKDKKPSESSAHINLNVKGQSTITIKNMPAYSYYKLINSVSQLSPHSTEPDVEDTPDNNEGNGRRPNKCKVIWTYDEEKCVAQAWSTISNCSKVGTSQKNKEFWEKTSAHYNENRPTDTHIRSGAAIKSHYYLVMPDVNSFSFLYNNFYNNRASGQSDDDVLQATIAQWHTINPKKKTFKYMHIWKTMKEFDEKWDPQHANKKLRTSESEGCTSTDSEVWTCAMGQQRAKRPDKSKVKVSDEDRIEKWEKLQQLQVEKLKQKDAEIKQKEIELMQKDYEIFMKDTSGMTSAQLQCHLKIIANISARRNW